ncbi:MAG: HU family DNA-binding protein [Oscillospiraceae bacterium]|nr:HU family DNA-binding protein [Oscillospiraceae bacterium]
MNKSDLKDTIAEKTGLTKKQSELAISALVDSIGEALKTGERVIIVGFGTFEVRERAERKGRNPQTKKEITIPASKAPVFKAGKYLKDLVN